VIAGYEEAKSISVPPSLLDPLAEQTTVISGLEKFTHYNLTVLCFTDPGDGDRSTPVEVRTNEDGKLELAVIIAGLFHVSVL
jgi:protein sidekick